MGLRAGVPGGGLLRGRGGRPAGADATGEAAGWRLYPAFDPAVRHYALRCGYRDIVSGRSRREGRLFSRMEEYALDPGAGTATFLRHHALHGAFERHARAWGGVQALANGNWPIGWGRGGRPQETPPPDVTLTEIDPASGEQLLAVGIEHDGKLLSNQAYRVGFKALEGALR